MEKKKIILALDLSTKSTGYSVLDLDSNIIESGVITPEKYKNYTKDRYPKSTVKNCKSVSNQVLEVYNELLENYDITNVVIEEINPGKGSIIASKTLSIVQGFIIDGMIEEADKIKFIKSSVWRSKLKMTLSYEQKQFNKTAKKADKFTFKHVSVDYVNKHYEYVLDYEDHDIADAICIGLGFLKG